MPVFLRPILFYYPFFLYIRFDLPLKLLSKADCYDSRFLNLKAVNCNHNY